jgi:YHS domain-containing protein
MTILLCNIGENRHLQRGGFMRFMKMLAKVFPAAVIVAMLAATGAMGQSEKSAKADTAKSAVPAIPAKQLKPQATCPVTGDPIDKNLYVDYKGKRIYVCCTDCIAPLKKNPEKYIKKLKKMGQGVETISDNSKMEGKDVKADTSMKGMDMKGMKMAGDTTSKATEGGYWTCPMHPEIHKTASGQCPICGMNLVFKKTAKETREMKGMDHSKMKM